MNHYGFTWDRHLGRLSTSTPKTALILVAICMATGPLPATTVVGTLPAEVSVDNKGAANCSVPLKTPPGRLGMQPRLSLDYSSNAGNGPLGIGFSLSTGFSHAIERGRSILARDGVVQGVSFTASDKFYLDGKRLLCVSGTYGSPGSSYRTEVDSFVSVTTAGSGSNIETFVVTDKNGIQTTFGKYNGTVDAYQVGAYDANGNNIIESGEVDSLAYAWAIKHVEDTSHNCVDFTYSTANDGEYVLNTIVYTGCTSPALTGSFTIQCYYNLNVIVGNAAGDTGRLDQPTQWVAGRHIPHTHRLDRLDVASGSTVAARYNFGYEYAPNAGPTRLKNVTPSLYDNSSASLTSVPQTTFGWSDGVPNPTYTGTANALVPNGNQSSAHPENSVAGSNECFAFADVDGDGIDDFVDARSGTTIMVSLGTGTGFGTPTSWLNLTGFWPGTPVVFKMCDINGDGKKDIVYGDPLETGSKKLYALVSTGTQFLPLGGGTTPTVIFSFTDEFRDPNSTNSVNPFAYQQRIEAGVATRVCTADFTGDGRDDVLIHRLDGKLQLLVSTGTSFIAQSLINVGATPISGYDELAPSQGGNTGMPWTYLGYSVTQDINVQMMPCDLNGDGIMDYVWIEKSGGWTHYDAYGSGDSVSQTIMLYAATSQPGGGFSQSTLVCEMSGGGSTTSPIPHRNTSFTFIPADVNGDGLTDFVCIVPGEQLTSGIDDNGNTWTNCPQRVLHHLVFLSQGAAGAPRFKQVDAGIPTSVTIGGQTVHPWFDKIAISEWVNDGYMSLNFQNPAQRPLVLSLGFGGAGDNMGMADLNGDGRADYYWYNNQTGAPGWYVMYSRGETFAPPVPAPLNWTPTSKLVEGAASYQLLTRSAADINGDGISDYTYAAPTFDVAPGVSGYYLSSGQPGVRLLNVTDGFGSVTSIDYLPVTNKAIYTPGAGVTYPIRELRSGGTYVVADLYKDSGGATPAQYSYQYSGNRLDLSGRGSLGFHSFVTLDLQTNLFKYQFLTQSFPMTGLSAREETYRYWISGSTANFRLISSHDNTVVFDEVTTSGGTAYGTLWPFISQAIESRWEDSSTAHFSQTIGSAASSLPEFLFSSVKPTGAYIAITAQSWFDNQSLDATGLQTTLAGLSGYKPSDTSPDPSSQVRTNVVGGTTSASVFDTLPRKIVYGNLTQLKTDYGSGFTETVTNTYLPPDGALTARVGTSVTSVTSPNYGTESSPTKTYTYVSGKPLVYTDTTTSTQASLNTVLTYGYSNHGARTSIQISGNGNSGDDQYVGTYVASNNSTFDANFDLPTTTLDAYLHPTTSAYDPLLGLPTSVTDPNLAQTTTQYDSLGRPLQVKDLLKGLEADTAYAWTSTSAIDWTKTQTVAPPSGLSGALTISSVYAVRSTSGKTGDASVSLKPPLTTYFDRLGRPIRSVKEGFAGQVISTDTIYNGLGQTVAVSLPYVQGGTAYWTTTTYDALGRVGVITAPNTTTTTNSYQGRATSVTVTTSVGVPSATSETNLTLVDPKGRTVSVWNADKTFGTIDQINGSGATPSVAFDLDGFGRMRKTTLNGQTGSAITATYDPLGYQATLFDPDKGGWSYLNNAFGEVVSQSDGNGTVTKSKFDELRRQLSRTITEPGASAPVETANWYYYDTADSTANHLVGPAAGKSWIGALAREECLTTYPSGYGGYGDPGTKTVHYYDSMGRPQIDLNQIDGKFFYTYTSYDPYSRIGQVEHYWRPGSTAEASNGTNTSPYLWRTFGYIYGYDTKSYLVTLTDNYHRLWWEADSNRGYDFLDRPVLVRKGAGNWTSRTYRPTDGVLTDIVTGSAATTGNVQQLHYVFDGFGNLRSRADSLHNLSESTGYDVLNRLTQTTVGSQTRNIGYDANGNVTSKDSVDGVSGGTYAYNSSHPHAASGAFGYSMQYDFNGNLLQRTGSSDNTYLKWNGFDKPRWMIRQTSTTAGYEYLYNAHHSRVVELGISSALGTSPAFTPGQYATKRIYALGSTLEVDYTNTATSGTPVWSHKEARIYVPAPDGIAGTMELTPTTSGGVTERMEVYHYDHLGSIESITPYGVAGAYSVDDASKTSRYSEDAWGQRRKPSSWSGSPDNTTSAGGPTDLTPRGFTGHEMLDSVGLVHMNGRIYDPLLGRFLSADLLVQNPGNLQAYNRYSYVRNNSLTLTDPSGWVDDGPDTAGFFSSLKALISVYIPSTSSLPGGSPSSVPVIESENNTYNNAVKAKVAETNRQLEAQVKLYSTADKVLTGGAFTDAAMAVTGKDTDGHDTSKIGAVGRLGVTAGLTMASGPAGEILGGAAGALAKQVGKLIGKESGALARVEGKAIAEGLNSTVKAAEANGANIALGSRYGSLRTFASEIGADHLLDVPEAQWKNVFEAQLKNPSTSFSVSMRGFFGDTPAEMILNEIKSGSNTGWELKQLQQAGRLQGVHFYDSAGKLIPNPFK